jgi:ubiquinone/menaquinone biosynthesis C-methylase UbiE
LATILRIEEGYLTSMTLQVRVIPDAMLTAHDRYFAPSVLSPFADDMARRVGRLSIGPLLEIAAGTGILTQAIASALSAGMTVIATDPSPEMVTHAAGKPGMARVIWQQADPAPLPFNDATFGIVVCQFGVAALEDPVRVFRQARRVMKQGGRFVFSVFGTLEQNPVADCLQGALDAFFPANPPRFIADALHGYSENNAIDDDLTDAGFTDAIYTTVDQPFVAASARDVAIGYCLGTPLRTDLELLTAGDTEPAVNAATRALERRFGFGAIEAIMRAHIISAAG